ncbi:LAMI_0H11870g1_1 [Lachancea mirantina]|uniref:LAMI_0H11870g1_1 n=1 Tax=Lachancea mirantina TaxID=1230905 RepID=A0A1G4KHN9_9SACH|nr:LAMI_0H11870g1_1 [Lachancea mirantina]
MGDSAHIVHKEAGLELYVPWLFPKSRFYQCSVPCFIADIAFYHTRTEENLKKFYTGESEVWFYQNHPIREVSVAGTVIGWRWKFFGVTDFAVFSLDDYSGAQGSLLVCKCTRTLLLASGMPGGDLTGRRLKLSGKLNRFGELEVRAVDMCAGFVMEIEFWKSAIKMRAELKRPWKLASGELGDDSEQSLFLNDLERQFVHRGLQIADSASLDHGRGWVDVAGQFNDSNFCLDFLLDDSVNMRGLPSEEDSSSDNTLLRNYQKRFLRLLMFYKSVEVSAMNVYKSPQLYEGLTTATLAQFHDAKNPSMKKTKELLFKRTLQLYVECGVISVFANGKIINTKNLKICCKYLSDLLRLNKTSKTEKTKIDHAQISFITGKFYTTKIMLEMILGEILKLLGGNGKSKTEARIDEGLDGTLVLVSSLSPLVSSSQIT